jgi:hypothetical protein
LRLSILGIIQDSQIKIGLESYNWVVIEQWYYWHESEILGPFSGNQLVNLAAAGDILPDDIVWKDGVEGGVPAHKVNHLFGAPSTLTPEATASESIPTTGTTQEGKPAIATGTATQPASPVEEVPKSSWDRGRATSSGKARAVAGKGTVLVGQDGVTVKFRMKCTVCGFEDSSWKSRSITRGTTRLPFYCPKCRKKCNVEIHGHVS